MKSINLDVRDFALTTNALKFMQEAYGDLEKLVGALGDNYVVSGCTVTGASVSDGIIVLKGKLLPFIGGTIGTNVRIKETVTTVTVGAGSRTETYYYAEFDSYSGDSTKNVTWSLIAHPFTSTTKTNFDFGGSGELLGTIVEKTTRVGAKVISSHATFTLTVWNNSGSPTQITVNQSALSFEPHASPFAPIPILRGTTLRWGKFVNNGSSWVITNLDGSDLNIGDVIYLDNIHK